MCESVKYNNYFTTERALIYYYYIKMKVLDIDLLFLVMKFYLPSYVKINNYFILT